MKPVAVIPTLCTLANAFCGFLAVAKGADAAATLAAAPEITVAVQTRFNELLSTACGLIFLAMVFDSLDGRIARMTQQTSDFGAMLDSLTDALTFGMAPALLLKFTFEATHPQASTIFAPRVILVLTVLFVCCALLRLARFTVETEEEADAHDFFRGLPTPAAAGFVCAAILFWILMGDHGVPAPLSYALGEETAAAVASGMHGGFLQALLLCMPVLALLMVTGVPYIHLFNRYMRGRKPYTYVAQVVFAVCLLVILKWWILFPAFLAYTVLCPLLVRWDTVRAKARTAASGHTEGAS